ncbi:MAG: trypsin-like peptidase domain-containing protein [Cellulophaga sp.]
MKKITSSLFLAIFAGTITLGAYKVFFETPNYNIVSETKSTPFKTASYTPTSTRSAGINEVDFTDAAQRTVNAVVHVQTVTISNRQNNIMEFFYGHSGRQKAQIGTGSGVIISSDGYIVTNNHVISNANKLQITLNNNKIYEAELIGTDPNSDIALLKIEAEEELPYLAFGDSDNTKIGEWVLAVGNPFNLTSTVTAGIISAKARDLSMGKNQSFIQTDAAVNPGNSGGALVDTNGNLIGINTAISSQTGSYVGYSFAVPSNIAKKVIDDIMEFGVVRVGMLGIESPDVTTAYALEKGINEIDGIYIENVEEDSGAFDADLQKGDIIKRIDKIDTHKMADLRGYISTKRLGDKVKLTIERNNETITTAVILKEVQSLTVPNMRLKVKNLSKKDKKIFRTDKGVKIIDVPKQYQGYGLEGKVLLAVGNKEIKNIHDARKLFSRISRHERTSITMLNKKGERERLIFQ